MNQISRGFSLLLLAIVSPLSSMAAPPSINHSSTTPGHASAAVHESATMHEPVTTHEPVTAHEPVMGHEPATVRESATVHAIGHIPVRSAVTSPALGTKSQKYSTTLKLKQHSRLAGDDVLWVTPIGVRLENPRSHVTLVARSPYWIVYKFNIETKKYVATPVSSFVNRFTGAGALFGGTVLSAATCAKTGEGEILENKTIKFTSDAAFAKKAAAMHKAGMVRDSFPESFIYNVLPLDMFPPEEAHIVSTVRGIPDVHGIPIELSCVAFDRDKFKYVSANEIQPATLPESQLEVPPGFRRVKEEIDITYDDTTKKDMLNFLESNDKLDKFKKTK